VRFVGVDYDDRRDQAIAFDRSLRTSYPSVMDPDGTLGDAFGILGLPATFIVGADQGIRFAVTGKIDPATFRQALDDVLAGAPREGSDP
jgi:cytochrome c biogenesis protein CcmG/thiol:disulfide interchange protein DsbE